MKTLILSTVAAAALAFTAGSALADQNVGRDTQWQVIEQSGNPAPVRHFTSSDAQAPGYYKYSSDSANDQAERESALTGNR